jgi:tRNA(Ile)-lysidine synthase TilS/MesJ
VALLHALATRNVPLIVCHLTTRYERRARESGVCRPARSTLERACEIAREDIAARAVEQRQSIETAAREARYAFFAQVAQRSGVAG